MKKKGFKLQSNHISMIESLKIKNFKSIKSAEVRFGRFNVLVGLNGAGKTNFLQALLLFKNLVGGLDISDAAELSFLSVTDILCKKDSPNKVILECRIKNGTDVVYTFEIELIKAPEPNPSEFIVYSEKLYKQSPLDKTPVLVYERDQAARVTLNDRSHVPLDVELNQLAIGIYLDPDAKNVKEIFRKIHIPDSAHLESRNPVARPSTRSLAGLILRLKHEKPDEYENFRKIVKKLIPSFGNFIDVPSNRSSQKHPNLEPPHLFLLEEEELEDRLSMRSLSLGDARTLYIVAAAIFRPENSTLVIEEIENGIHPKRMVDLVDRLQTISRMKDMQIIFTTHSPALINKQSIEDIVYLEKSGGETRVTTYRDSSNLQKIQDVLNEGGKITDFIYERR